MGLAWVDRSRCLPWSGEAPCIVCEEHCPTAQKAIRLVEQEVVMPDGTKRTLPAARRRRVALHRLRDLREQVPADRPRGDRGHLSRGVPGRSDSGTVGLTRTPGYFAGEYPAGISKAGAGNRGRGE